MLNESAKARELRFRRQQPIHPYIADFACMEARLLIELDGASHDARQNYDRVRENFLKQKGFSIVRFTNEDVSKNVDGVVRMILEQAESLIRNGAGQGKRRAPHPNQSSAFDPFGSNPHKGEGINAALVEME